jgi:hypothetical protein
MFRRSTARACLFLVLVGLTLGACASSKMMDVAEPPIVATPPGDQAVLVFLRPSFFGGAIQSSVFDVTAEPPSFVAIVSAGKKVAITRPPGQYRFMVVSEAADFMDAIVTAGKTYYTLVTPRMGLWKARFSLRPMEATDAKLDDYLAETSWSANTPASQIWANESLAGIRVRQAEYIQEWLAKPDKPILKVSDGR